jgi:hypothetical protein
VETASVRESTTSERETELELDLPDPSGYGTHDEYFATRFQQGGRTVYSLDLSIPQLVATLPKPDPDKPQQGNRRIQLAHARGFGEYIRERPDWVSPSLLLRAPEDEFSFEAKREIGGTEFGILRVPRLARNQLKILDGQHRILGFHLAWELVDQSIQDRREALAIARRNGSPAIRDAERNLDKATRLREQLAAARVSIDIVIVDDPEAYKQVFVDIADNAKGVTRTLSARFDRRKVVHRALPLVVEHPLLETRVEEESDRLSTSNTNLLTAKNVADIIRTVQVGVARRVSRKLEDELDDRTVAGNATRFLDVLVDAFPDLETVMEGQTSPQELRRNSLLGSATMLRVFAGVYYELVRAEPEAGRLRMTDDEVTAYLSKYVKHMAAPLDKESPLFKTGLFKESGMAPEASQGDLRQLVDKFVTWAETEPDWLQ